MLVHVVPASLVLLSCIVFHSIGVSSGQVTTASSPVNTILPPRKESAVSVTNVTSSKALIKWTWNGTLFMIRLWKDDNTTVGNFTEKFNTELFVNNLQPWTKYRVEVSTQGNSTNSSTVVGEETFRTQCTAPSAPRHLEVVNVTSNSITLRWQPPEHKNGPLEGYSVFFMPKDDHQGGNSLATTTTSATVTSLVYNTEYSVYLKAYNKVNKTELSSEAVGVTASTVIAAPSKVRKLHLVSLSDASAVVGWNPPVESNGPLDGYRVYWCLGIDTTSEGHQPGECRTQELLGHVTRAHEVGLLSNTNYSVYVSPFNFVRNRTSVMLVGEEAKIYVQTLREPPQAVENIKVHVVSKTSATILWEAVPDAEGYIVEWCQSGNCTEETTNETEITIKDLQMGTNYNVSVVGYRKDPEGEKQTGPFRSAQVLFQSSHEHTESPRHSKYIAGTIVCSFLVVLLAIAIVYVWRRPWAKPGPTPYKRMSSLDQDDDDILFMKPVPTKSL